MTGVTLSAAKGLLVTVERCFAPLSMTVAITFNVVEH
jgi:hypothetical protein